MARERPLMQRVKVMLVDDDRDWVESMADLFEAYGYDVEIAFDGGAALHRFRKCDYDIAFMDVRMPGMNGVDSFLAIRRRPSASRRCWPSSRRTSDAQRALTFARRLLRSHS
jgi:CheY-like chemotaxis protein